MELVVLKNESLDDLTKEGMVVIDFFATWCGPCQMLGPVLEDVAAKREDVKIIKVDVDEHQELAMKHGVMSVPTLVLFKDNKEVAKQSGFMNEDALNEWVDQNK